MESALFLPLANKNLISSYELCNLIKKKSKFKKKIITHTFSDGGDDADVIFEKNFNYKRKIARVYNYKKQITKCAYYTKGKNLFIHGKNILGGKIKQINTLKYSSYGIGQIINKNLDKKKNLYFSWRFSQYRCRIRILTINRCKNYSKK